MGIKDPHDELLKSANTMERERLVTAAEWRQRARKAGAGFA